MNALSDEAWDEPPSDPHGLRERLELLDRLELSLLGMAADTEPYRHAAALQAKLVAGNDVLYRRMRQTIRQGIGAKLLLEWAAALIDGDGARGDGYGPLDDLIGGVLAFEPLADAEIRQPAEMVFYQPTPARHIFALIERAGLGAADVVVDLGAGLGHVPLLVAICTGARGIGIEREAAYVDCARGCAQALNVSAATFIRQDARDADFSRGTLFYLYTPFGGAVLRAVLDALRREAAVRTIRIATYGPCTQAVLAEPWLASVGQVEPDRVVLFRSVPGDSSAA